MIDYLPSLQVAATVDDLVGYRQITDAIGGKKVEMIRSVASTLCANGADIIVSVDTIGRVTFWRRDSECVDSDHYQRLAVKEERWRGKTNVPVVGVTGSG